MLSQDILVKSMSAAVGFAHREVDYYKLAVDVEYKQQLITHGGYNIVN